MDWIIAELLGSGQLPLGLVLLRVCGAALLSSVIGFEREAQGRPAGLRTHMLVGIASCIYSLVTLEIVAASYDSDVRMDPLRIVEAVTGGVAFLAAGMIVFARGAVRGLTTGAGLWLAAAVGLCAGLGLWPMAVIATALALGVVLGLRPVEDRLLRRRPAPAGEQADANRVSSRTDSPE